MNLLLMLLHHHLFLISLLSSSSLAISSSSQTPVTKSSSDRSSVILNSTSTTTTADDGDVTLLNYNTDAMTKKKRRRKKKKIRKSSRNTKKKKDENSQVDVQESQNNSIKNNNDNPVGRPIRSKSPSLPSSSSSSRSAVLKKKSNKIIKKRKVSKQKKTPLHSQQQQQQQQDDKPKESSTHNHDDDNETILRQHIATSSYLNISTPQSHQRDKNRNQQRQPNTNTARQNHQIPQPSYPSNNINNKKNYMKTKKQTTPTPSMTTSTTTTTKWIRNYIVSLRLTKNEILFPVPRDFITDSFNLQRLSDKIIDSTSTNTNNNNNKSKNGSSILFRSALRMILDNYNTNSPPSNNSEEDNSIIIKEVERAAQILYGLIHARFVLSPRGLDTVRRALLMDRTQKKNKNKRKKLVASGGGILNPIFGKCPRLNCHGNPLLPCGLNDLPPPSSTTKPVMRYCCSCGEVFYSSSIATAAASALPATSTATGVRQEKEKDILPILDGSAWGTSFPHLLLMVYGQDLFPQIKNSSLVKKSNNNNNNNNNRHTIKNELDTTMITKRDDYKERMTSYLQQHTSSTSTSSCVVQPRIFGFRVHPNKASFTYPVSVSSVSYKRSQHND